MHAYPEQWLTPARRRRWRHTVLGSDGPRRYLAAHLTLESFFRTLDERGVRYAVLRWFETLPHVDPGEDVDLLVDDEHLDFVHTLLRPRPARPSSQAFDVYTVSGLPGTDFGGGVPYYPPDFARRLLDTAVDMRGLCRVPAPVEHLLSLGYHATYHKGYASGLAPDARSTPLITDADHDYAAVVTDLAQQVGAPTEPTLESLDELLAEADLRPPLDTLERLSDNNRWIRDRFLTDRPPVDDAWQGLAVFVVRERAAEHCDLVADELDRHGFEVLEILALKPEQAERARRRIRGGNWERGPWQVSGGGPSHFIVTYDVAPWQDSADDSEVNRRIADAKEKIRDRLIAELGGVRFNPLHSSDNPRQALDYLDVLDVLDDPQSVARWRDQVTALREACRLPFPLIRWLSGGAASPSGPARRARVALVDHPVHGPSVCKIFRPGAHRFFRRELEARRSLARIPQIPELLDHGDGWLLTTAYQDDGRHCLRHLPFDTEFENAFQLTTTASRALVEFAGALHEEGLFILDLTTENVVSDPEAGLKVLDLEFLQPYAGSVPDFAHSYSLRGIPDDVRSRYDQPQEVPFTGPCVGNPVFHPAVSGLPVDLLAEPSLYAAALRPLNRWVWYLYLGVARPPHRLNAALNRFRWGRLAKRVVKKGLRVARSARRP